MPVNHVNSDEAFVDAMRAAGMRPVVVNFFAEWCGPSKGIAPFYDQLSNRYPSVVFLKVDVDKCEVIAAANGVCAMPTFAMFVNKSKVDSVNGANQDQLEGMVNEFADAQPSSPAPGQIDLATLIDKEQMEVLNEDDDTPLANSIAGPGKLRSSCDEQLIISLPTTEFLHIPAHLRRMARVLIKLNSRDESKRKLADEEFKQMPRRIKLGELLDIYHCQKSDENLRSAALDALHYSLQSDWFKKLQQIWEPEDFRALRPALIMAASERKSSGTWYGLHHLIIHVSRQRIGGTVSEWPELVNFLGRKHETKHAKLRVLEIIRVNPHVLGRGRVSKLVAIIDRYLHDPVTPIKHYALMTYEKIVTWHINDRTSLKVLGRLVKKIVKGIEKLLGDERQDVFFCLTGLCWEAPHLLIGHVGRLFTVCVEASDTQSEVEDGHYGTFALLRAIVEQHWNKILAQCGQDAIDLLAKRLVDQDLNASAWANCFMNGEVARIIAEIAKNDVAKRESWPELDEFMRRCSISDSRCVKDLGLILIVRAYTALGKEGRRYAHKHIKKHMSPRCPATEMWPIFTSAEEDKKEPTIEVKKAFRHVINAFIQSAFYEERYEEFGWLVNVANTAPTLLQPRLTTILEVCIKEFLREEDALEDGALVMAILCEKFASSIPEEMIEDLVNCALIVASDDLDANNYKNWSQVNYEKNYKNWSQVTRLGMITKSAGLLDDVIGCFPTDQTVPFLLETYEESKDTGDKKEQFKGVIALMAAGERCRGRDEEEKIVLGIIDRLDDPSELVRNLACATLHRMMSCWGGAHLQENYHGKLIPALISRVTDHSFPRVAGHAAIVLAKFVDTCPKHITHKYFGRIMQTSLEMLQRSQYKFPVSERHEVILSEMLPLVSSIVNSAPERLAKFHNLIMRPLRRILSDDEDHYAAAIACMSHVGSAAGREKFADAAFEVMETICSNINALVNADSSLHESLVRLSSTLDLSPFLPTLMPPILRAAGGDENAKEWCDVLTRKDAGQKMILGLIRAVGDGFAPYIDETTTLVNHELARPYGDSSWALSMAPLLLSAVKPQGELVVRELWAKMRPGMKRGEMKWEWSEAMKECLELLGDELSNCFTADKSAFVPVFPADDEAIGDADENAIFGEMPIGN